MPKIDLKNPGWIYEGTDPDKMEPVSADVTNRAPKDNDSNIKKVKDRVLRDEYNENAIVLGEYTDYDDDYNYMKGDIVQDPDDNSKRYVSITDDNKGNELTDTDNWKEYLGAVLNVLIKTEAPSNDEDKGYPIGQLCVDKEHNRTYTQTSEDPDNPNWIEVSNVGDTDLASEVVDSNKTATSNTYLLARTDDDTGDYTIKLPDGPADMDLVKIADYDNNASNNPVHIDGNGNKIEGYDSVDLDVDDFIIEFTWNDDAKKWVMLNK